MCTALDALRILYPGVTHTPSGIRIRPDKHAQETHAMPHSTRYELRDNGQRHAFFDNGPDGTGPRTREGKQLENTQILRLLNEHEDQRLRAEPGINNPRPTEAYPTEAYPTKA